MTKEVIDAGGNVGASQAAKLGKYFSLMMLVEVPTAEVESLEANLQKMHDLSASVCHTKEEDDDITFASSSSYTIGYKGQLTLEGADNPGIVNKVTKILSSNGLNIYSMETSDELAPGGSTGKIISFVVCWIYGSGRNRLFRECSAERLKTAPHYLFMLFCDYPTSSTVLFRMKGIAHAYEPLSAGFDVSKIKQELSELGDHLNCDIVLKDIE